MRLWLLSRSGDEWGYDEASAFVVRAETEEEARRLAAERRGDEGEDAWLTRADVAELTAEGSAGVILRDFNAG